MTTTELQRTTPQGYRLPNWWGKSFDYGTLTDDLVNVMRADAEECEAFNKQHYAALAEKVADAKKLLAALYGPDSTVVRAVKRAGVPYPPTFSSRDIERRVAEARQIAKRVAALKERAEEQRKLTERAVIWLQARGKVLGSDFSLDDALTLANDIAADDEQKRLLAKGGWHDFDGQNCDGPCSGWDGESRRCECGNRRVSWSTSDWHNFEHPDVRGEAY